MPLYEVAVVSKPTKKEIDENGVIEELILPPKAVVARDPQGAAIAAVRELKDLDVNRSEVLVRPFA